MIESPFETPEADAAEQQAEVVPEEDETPPADGSDEVEPADRAEQERIVGHDDEDEYR